MDWLDRLNSLPVSDVPVRKIAAWFYLRELAECEFTCVDRAERTALLIRHLRDNLPLSGDIEADIMKVFYDGAKAHFGLAGSDIRAAFECLYLFLFGDRSGPRWGTFCSLVGVDKFLEMINDRLDEPFFRTAK